MTSAFKPSGRVFGGALQARCLSMEWDFKTFKKETDERMSKSLESCLSQMNTIRAGGANPQLLDRIQVEYFGTYTPLQQLARVSAQGSEQLIV